MIMQRRVFALPTALWRFCKAAQIRLRSGTALPQSAAPEQLVWPTANRLFGSKIRFRKRFCNLFKGPPSTGIRFAQSNPMLFAHIGMSCRLGQVHGVA
jgi:hypothetical protein